MGNTIADPHRIAGRVACDRRSGSPRTGGAPAGDAASPTVQRRRQATPAPASSRSASANRW